MSHAVELCTVCGNTRPMAARGLCGGCYGRQYRAAHPDRPRPPSRALRPAREPGSRVWRATDALTAGVITADVPELANRGGVARPPQPWRRWVLRMRPVEDMTEDERSAVERLTAWRRGR